LKLLYLNELSFLISGIFESSISETKGLQNRSIIWISNLQCWNMEKRVTDSKSLIYT
jgi:hypothetical protein